MAEPLPRTVDKGFILVKARKINELSLAQNQMPTQITTLGARGVRFQLAAIFAAVEKSIENGRWLDGST